jgi:hypothetical protein
MKKQIILLTFLLCFFSGSIDAKSLLQSTVSKTSIGIVIYSNDTETVWNALRLANYSKNQGDTVSIFLLGKGVELDNLVKINNDVKDQVDKFLGNQGTIMGCGTCLHSRNNDMPQVCIFSSLKDLYQLIRKNKTVLTF